MRFIIHNTITAFFIATLFTAHAQEDTPFPVSIVVDAGKPLGSLKPIWRYFGADEPNYAYMKDGKKLAVMVWHYHDDDIAGPDAAINLNSPGLPFTSGTATVTHYRIDETHSNAFTLWQALVEPQKPTSVQYADLEAAGKLTTLGPAAATSIRAHAATLNFPLPRQGVSLLVLEWQ